jgi:hypothetical protein
MVLGDPVDRAITEERDEVNSQVTVDRLDVRAGSALRLQAADERLTDDLHRASRIGNRLRHRHQLLQPPLGLRSGEPRCRSGPPRFARPPLSLVHRP